MASVGLSDAPSLGCRDTCVTRQSDSGKVA